MEHPEVTSLFKYFRFDEFGKKNLEEGTFWFSRPDELNDPFDCRPPISRPPESWIKKRALELGVFNGLSSASDDVMEGLMAGHDQAVDGLYQDLNRSGICCLTEDPLSVLMWTHYANDHTGFCVEYERDALGLGDSNRCFQVQYPDSIVIDFEKFMNLTDEVRRGVSHSEELTEMLVLRKSRGWAYEKEWRILNEPGPASYKGIIRVKSVIAGLGMDANNKARLRELAGEGVVLSEVCRSPDHARLEIRRA